MVKKQALTPTVRIFGLTLKLDTGQTLDYPMSPPVTVTAEAAKRIFGDLGRVLKSAGREASIDLAAILSERGLL